MNRSPRPPAIPDHGAHFLHDTLAVAFASVYQMGKALPWRIGVRSFLMVFLLAMGLVAVTSFVVVHWLARRDARNRLRGTAAHRARPRKSKQEPEREAAEDAK